MAWDHVVDEFNLRGLGLISFSLYNSSTWEWWHYILWVLFIYASMELLGWVTLCFRPFFSSIPMRGKHLDDLSTKDVVLITFNRLTAPIFTYQIINYCWYSDALLWDLRSISFINTVVAVCLFFIVFDFFYTIYHWALHLRPIYKYIHKHHHRQMAPTRGNLDAVNVHPIEFLMGEYNHWLSVFLVALLLGKIHYVAVVFFIVIGGLLASLNHTRFDIKIPLVYKVKNHDLHHWKPSANFGQYTMLWDYVFGWFEEYPELAKDEKNK